MASAFDSSLALQAGYLRARDGLAAVLTEQGDFEQAEKIFRANLLVDPNDPIARGGLALIEQRKSAAAEAAAGSNPQ